MTATPGCHSDSLWKERGREREGEEGERVSRCTDVSLAPPSDAERREEQRLLKKDLKGR